MLAQNFKTAADLGLTQPQFDALAKTLVMLETGKLTHIPFGEDDGKTWGSEAKFTGHFCMANWRTPTVGCGTVACIGGTAELIGDLEFNELAKATVTNRPLAWLFYPYVMGEDWESITPEQAASALRSYLTTGKDNWGNEE